MTVCYCQLEKYYIDVVVLFILILHYNIKSC
jgi:hypothetical protein